MGIEPTSEAWEASILPLYDARSALFAIIFQFASIDQQKSFVEARFLSPVGASESLGVPAFHSGAISIQQVPLLLNTLSVFN
jgi:hypothetical protein